MSFDLSIFLRGVQCRVVSDSKIACPPIASDTLVAAASSPVYSGLNLATSWTFPAASLRPNDTSAAVELKQSPRTPAMSTTVKDSPVGLQEAAPRVLGFDFSTFLTAWQSRNTVSDISLPLTNASTCDTTVDTIAKDAELEDAIRETDHENIGCQVEEDFLSRVRPTLSVTFSLVLFNVM